MNSSRSVIIYSRDFCSLMETPPTIVPCKTALSHPRFNLLNKKRENPLEYLPGSKCAKKKSELTCSAKNTGQYPGVFVRFKNVFIC